MNYDTFIKSTTLDHPSNDLSNIQLALWYIVNNHWDKAHNIIQGINTDVAAWIHAYLHRLEGDIGNAKYWYNRANKPCSKLSLKLELEHIIKTILNDN